VVDQMTPDQLIHEIDRRNDRLRLLKNLGRVADGLQIGILLTMGQYLYSGGAQKLSGAQWVPARDWFGGYQNVGISLIVIGVIGLIGLFSLAVTRRDYVYAAIMWVYSLLAASWFIGIGITHGLARAGSTGLWTLGLSGLFFLFTRIAITVASAIHEEDE